jgi:DNA polymerase-3 subunit epsilon
MLPTLYIIDFEGHRDYGVVEYGIVAYSRGAIKECHTRLCRAEQEIFPADVRLHGIRTKDTLAKSPFSDEREFFFNMRSQGLLGAHNAVVENNLIKRTWPHPPFSPSFGDKDETIAEWGPWIDTLCLYQYAYPTLESHKLGDLIRAFRLEALLEALAQRWCPPNRARWHCALYDALASALLLQWLLQQPGYSELGAEQLVAMSCRKRNSNQMNLF